MLSLPLFNRRFTPGWLMTFLAALTLGLLLRLGFWQLERASEKKVLLQSFMAESLKKPLLWQEGFPKPKPYEPLIVTGTYLTPIFFLDNQHHQHQFGFSVLSPLLVGENKVLLIDRGFIAADITRQTLPKIIPVKGQVKLSGIAYYPSLKGLILGKDYEQKEGEQYIIERIDPLLVERLLHKSVYPFIIRLDKNDSSGFIREWAIVSMPPERHYAYALQWFAMALVVLILYIGLNLKKK